METWKILAPGWTSRVSLVDGSVTDGGRRPDLLGMSRIQLASACTARGWILRKS